MAGKGDKRRKCDEKKVARNWIGPDRIVKVWERDKDGKLKN